MVYELFSRSFVLNGKGGGGESCGVGPWGLGGEEQRDRVRAMVEE